MHFANCAALAAAALFTYFHWKFETLLICWARLFLICS